MKKYLGLTVIASLVTASSAYAAGPSLPAVLSQGALSSLSALPSMPAANNGAACTVCLPTYRVPVAAMATRVQYFAKYNLTPAALPGLPNQMVSNVPAALAEINWSITTATGTLGGPAPVPKRPADFIDAVGHGFNNAFFAATAGQQYE